MADFDDAQIWTGSYSFIQAGMDAASVRIAELGIDIKEFLVVERVDRIPSPAELAKSLSIPKATMTGYVKELEVKGLIDRKINREDLRRYRLCLTSAGEELVSKGRMILKQVFEERLSNLHDSERKEFKRLIEKLTDH